MAFAPPIAAESLHAKKRLQADVRHVHIPRAVRCGFIYGARVAAAFIEPNEAKSFSDTLRAQYHSLLQREDWIDSSILKGWTSAKHNSWQPARSAA